MAIDVNSIVEQLSGLTVVEALQITKLLEEKWGVSASAPITSTVQQVAEIEVVKEEQTEFTVSLVSFDAAKKIGVIKEIRTITGLGLKEAKEFVESAPKVIREFVSKADADKIKEVLEAASAIVEIK